MRAPNTRLAQVREQRGLTQRQLGELIGLSSSSVSGIENGHIRPWPKFRRDVADLLDLNESDLFDDLMSLREPL